MSDAPAPARDPHRPDRAALAIALALGALAAIVAWDAATMRAGVASYSRIGPEVFPFGVAAGLAALALFTAVEAFRGGLGAPPPRDEIAPGLWIVGGLVAQILLLPVAGFSIATGAVFAATARAFGRGPVLVTYPIGVAFALAVWTFFARGLDLVLPAGPLERLL